MSEVTDNGTLPAGQEEIVSLEGGYLKEFRPVDTKLGCFLRLVVEVPLARAAAAQVLPSLWRMRNQLGLRAILVHDELQAPLPGFEEEDPRRTHYVPTG